MTSTRSLSGLACALLVACGGGSDEGAPGSGGQASGGAGGATGGAGGAGGAGGIAGSAGVGGSAGIAGAAGISGSGGSGGAPPNCTPSTTYGLDGEAWKPDGRLLDWAWAGYRTGNVPLPTPASPAKSVTDFGATPDDSTDDTQAFLAAIAGTPSGVITIPAGKFVISERLEIKKSNLVLRGAGRDKTTLYLPKALGDVYGLTFNSAGQSNWSFSGGFITVQGSIGGAALANVTANAKRGEKQLSVSSSAGFTKGQWVRLLQTDVGGGLLKLFHEGYYPGDVDEDTGKTVFKFASPIAAVESGKITLERPLPLDVNTTFTPELRAFTPSVKEVGVEHLTMEFAGTPYPGHFKEHGYNAIYFQGVSDSWVRDVAVLNSDYGVNLGGSFFCTVTDVVLDTNFDRGSLTGHHGLNAGGGADLWFTKFDVKKRFIHDLTVDNYAFATVFSDGKGVDIDMDHHGRGNYGTLFSALDLGAGNRPFASGGTAPLRMPHSGARSTYWNLTAGKDITLPATDFGPLLTFVSVRGSTGTASPDWMVENIPPAALCQKDLHAAMLKKRGP
ncbi:MAG: glycosyl hydrolase family 28-related protein [Polyangiaceae bacterium]